MRTLIALVSVTLHGVVGAADVSEQNFRYWASAMPPGVVFAQGIYPPGKNDNLQQMALGRSCISDDDSSAPRTGFVAATQKKHAIETDAMKMSKFHAGRDFFVYRVQINQNWHALGRSLMAAYPTQQAAVRALALIHEADATWIHAGPVASHSIERVTRFSGGKRQEATINPGYQAGDNPPVQSGPYKPDDREYDPQQLIHYARQNDLFLDACVARNFCNSTQGGPFRSVAMTQTCSGLQHELIPTSQYLAWLSLPILFDFNLDNGSGAL